MNKPLITPEEKKEPKSANLTVPTAVDIPMIDDSPTTQSDADNARRVSINDLKHNSRDYCKRFSEEVTQEPVVLTLFSSFISDVISASGVFTTAAHSSKRICDVL